MRHTHHQHHHFIREHCLHDHIVLAGMNPAQFRIAFKLAGRFAVGVLGQQTKPTRHTPAHVLRQFLDLALCLAGKLNGVFHFTAPAYA